MHSKKFKNFMAKLYGFGAAIVIMGAMFKILHLPGANFMLGLGLTTEAVIFFFSAFEKPHEEVDWSLVYPELAGMDSHNEGGSAARVSHGGGSARIGASDGVSQELDKLMQEANIGPELIQSLGDGLRNFGERVATISTVTDIAANTSDLSNKLKSASDSVESLSKSYLDASSSLTAITATASDAKSYQEQMQNLSKNLSSLNAMYELELQDSNNHMKVLNSFYASMNETATHFNETINDAKLYKEEVSKLAKNLASLNAVYGNMLSAMNVPRG